jgi:hypothetical protein
MRKHTATPWKVEVVGTSSDYSNPVDVCEILSADGYAQIAENLRDANAAHIVRCVNAHDELVALLKQAHESLCGGIHHEGLPSRIRAALAKVAA